MKTCTFCKKAKPLTEFRKKLNGLTARCGTCLSERDRAYKARNREAGSKRDRAYYEVNKERVKERQRAYYRDNAHSYKQNALQRKRQVRAHTPKWLNSDQKAAIKATYDQARDCEVITGEAYHVDHIVPLKHSLICGLHVPWNLQVLPGDLNDSKGNSFDGGWDNHGMSTRTFRGNSAP